MTPMADGRYDRRELLSKGAMGAAALALAGCGGADASTTVKDLASAKPKPIPKPRHTSIGDLRQAVRGRVITKGTSGYKRAAEVYNERWDGARPLAIVEARGEHDVVEAVRWAGRRDVSVVPRSGGHSYAGYSTGDDKLVIDLSRLRGIKYNKRDGTATIGTGSQLIDVYSGLAAHGVTTPAGSCPSVGAGGHVAVGGMGLAARRFGLACDNLKSLSVVTADGELLTAAKRSHGDLYWATRGGGAGNFGVATRYEMKVHSVDYVAYCTVTWPWDRTSDALDAWQHLMLDAPDELTSIFHVSTGTDTPSVSVSGQYFGDEAAMAEAVRPLRDSGGSVTTGTLGYLDMMRYWAGCATIDARACHTRGTRPGGTLPRALFDAKSDYFRDPLDSGGRDAMKAAIERRQADSASGSGAILLDSYGGAINRVGAKQTAFVHRDEIFCAQYLAYYPSAGALGATKSWLEGTASALRPYATGMAYQGYIDPALKGWAKAYYGENLKRLRQIKRRYDPDFRFRYPQAIRPSR